MLWRISGTARLTRCASDCGSPLQQAEARTSESYNPSNLGNAMLAFAWYGQPEP